MDRDRLASSFRFQAEASRTVGSAIYPILLERCREDLIGGGPTLALVEDWEGDPILENLPLRLLGTVHREVLAGRAPQLAHFYPSAGGEFEPEGAWSALRALLAERREALRPGLDQQVQTNEVNRACALVAGVGRFADQTGLPIDLLEIGASAGLNLVLDQFHFELGDVALGPPDAPLVLRCEWRGKPLSPTPFTIRSRRGCDPYPIDLHDADARLRLESYFWPDQLARIARLRSAIAAATPVLPELTRARARDWLPTVARPAPGAGLLLQQSVMWWYLPEAERAEVQAIMEEAGAQATADAPLGWLRMEGADPAFCELRLRSWPGGQDQLLAHAHWHGAWVEWRAEA